jgi:hypothetical protein
MFADTVAPGERATANRSGQTAKENYYYFCGIGDE